MGESEDTLTPYSINPFQTLQDQKQYSEYVAAYNTEFEELKKWIGM